jgi:hypothetical protein
VCFFLCLYLSHPTYKLIILYHSHIHRRLVGFLVSEEREGLRNLPDSSKNYNRQENFFIGNKTSGRVFEICDVYETRRPLAHSRPSDLHFSSSSTSFVFFFFFFIIVIYCGTGRKELLEWLKKKVSISTWEEWRWLTKLAHTKLRIMDGRVYFSPCNWNKLSVINTINSQQ